MFYLSGRHYDLPAEITRLVFKTLVGDSKTLARAGLVCQKWRILSLPLLLEHVDISSHNINIGDPRDLRNESYPPTREIIISDTPGDYCSIDHVRRQRAFLRFMMDRPELLKYIKTFIWTLVWVDFGEKSLTDIDLQTWHIFEQMHNVTRLDLASVHNIGDQPYIRQNPPKLFPAVTHLRLFGWMNRGLVKTILSSIDRNNLCSLQLDHLEEEGALPDGRPMPQTFAALYYTPVYNPYNNVGIDNALWKRQEQGEAGIFPGPMWFPLRYLSEFKLPSLTHLEVKLSCIIDHMDTRNTISVFNDVAEFIHG